MFALPALVAVVAWRRRRPSLLLPAGIASLALSVALAISLVTIPLVVPGVLYLLAYGRSTAAERTAVGPAGAVPVAAAIVALGIIVFTPGLIVCWSETVYEDGRTVLVRDHASEKASGDGHFSQSSGPPRPGVVEESGGCTDGAVRPVASLGALGLVAAALIVGWRLT